MTEVKTKPRLESSWIAPAAQNIVSALQDQGFAAYLVGGCVRDLLVGVPPKDFDIATSAEPEQVKKSIRGSYIIGRRFRLVLVRRGDQQYEVATFRRALRPEDQNTNEGEEPVITGDNFFGTPEEDALRRDFTVNALFYDPSKNEIIDYANGLPDIDARILRVIGDPEERLIEDPIRSLRAIRLSHKIGFSIEPKLRQAIENKAEEIAKSILPRKREEYLKILRLDQPDLALMEMHDLKIMQYAWPKLSELLSEQDRFTQFIHIFHKLNPITASYQQPSLRYLPMVIALQQALELDSTKEDFLSDILKEEMGIFKGELTEIFYVLKLAKDFPDPASFLKRGQRRQSGFLNTPYLELALEVSKTNFHIPTTDYWFWRDKIRQT